MDIQELINAVREWGESKGITGPEGKGTLMGQMNKAQEELNETRDAAVLCQHLAENDFTHEYETEQLKDGIGDLTVVSILAAELAGLKFEDCLLAAYNVIKNRKGQMIDGQFVKNREGEG